MFELYEPEQMRSNRFVGCKFAVVKLVRRPSHDIFVHTVLRGQHTDDLLAGVQLE